MMIGSGVALVRELLRWRKLFSIHTFICSRQVVSFDGDEGDAEGGIGAVALTAVCRRRSSGMRIHDG